MSYVSRAIGLTTLGNPLTLIASLERLSKLCPQYKLYVCLNPQREYISDEQFEYIINSSYKIIQSYEHLFKEIIIIEPHYKAWWGTKLWATHGFCIDSILTLSEEEHMCIFEEDAFVFDNNLFYEWFDKLNDVHIVCGMNSVTPNNSDIFDKLTIFPSVPDVVGPGKESILFVDKYIKTYWDWFSTDYFKLETNTSFKPKVQYPYLNFKREVMFDTFEFFSLMCYLNTDIKINFYKENGYSEYWRYQGMGKPELFYEKHKDSEQYMHYFHTSLFQVLEYHSVENKQIFKDLLIKQKDNGHFVNHLSTYILGMAFLSQFKSQYIKILGKEQYIKHRTSLKNYISLLIEYYTVDRIKHEFNMRKFARFTYRYVKHHHSCN